MRLSSVYFLFQGLFLWDFHVLAQFERWQRRCGRLARRWIDGLGDVEAISALAGLAHDNPDWAFPSVDAEESPRIDATGSGHPLIREDIRVTNDATVGPPGTFLLVTGSNMSGKSTLLRAIGLNVVLAQAGGPVCARRFRMPPVELYSSMRIQDSLEEGISYFMAGVLRLKTILEATRAHHQAGRLCLYLLDEILQGTNTAERQIAVRNIIGELLALRAIGVVTTHDLALAASGELGRAGHAVHFSETIEPGHSGREATMAFDYKLRSGLATSTNALRLMRLMGLDHVGSATPESKTSKESLP